MSNWTEVMDAIVSIMYLCTYIKSMGIFLIGVRNMIGGLSANLIERLKAQLGNSCLFGNLCAIFLGVVVVMLSISIYFIHLLIILHFHLYFIYIIHKIQRNRE